MTMRCPRYTLPLAALLTTSLMVARCDNTPVTDTAKPLESSYRENIINANKVIASSEETQIDSYLSRRGWQMRKLGDGVRYQEYQRGKGKKLDFEDHVSITYRLEALDGKVIYDGQSDTVTLGKHRPNEGLDHALMQLYRGSKARVIVPSSMGYGVRGDGGRVPGRTVLVYNIEVK